MFNPLTPAEMVAAIGGAARDAARRRQELDEFARGQLLSAYSATRHLAVELRLFDAEREAFRSAVAELLGAAIAAGGIDEPAFGAIEGRLGHAATEPGALGAVVCDLLELLRGRDDPAATHLRDGVRDRLRELCDREVELLASAIERA